jgi:hypothetical protein
MEELRKTKKTLSWLADLPAEIRTGEVQNMKKTHLDTWYHQHHNQP